MGPPPDPLRIPNLSGALGNLENAMKSSLNTTYFITKHMKVDLQQQNLNGVLPILYVFLVRADKSITNVTFGSLNSNGAFEEFAPGKKGGSTPGVRIRYTDNQSGNSQTLYYFTTDISDGGIKSAPGFLKFCQRLGSGSSFLKVFFVSDVRAGLRDHPRISSLTIATESCRTTPEFPWLISIQTNGTCVFLAFTSARSISSNNITSPGFRKFFGKAIRLRSTSGSVIAGTTRKPI